MSHGFQGEFEATGSGRATTESRRNAFAALYAMLPPSLEDRVLYSCKIHIVFHWSPIGFPFIRHGKLNFFTFFGVSGLRHSQPPSTNQPLKILQSVAAFCPRFQRSSIPCKSGFSFSRRCTFKSETRLARLHLRTQHRRKRRRRHWGGELYSC